MSKKAKEANRLERKQEKEAVKSANVAKVAETKAVKSDKPKTVWDLLREEREGTRTTTNAEGVTTTKKSKVRRVLAVNCHAHRRSGKLRGSVCIQRNDMSIARVKRAVAAVEVKTGKAKYVARSIWKDMVKNQILRETTVTPKVIISKTDQPKTAITVRKTKRVWIEKEPDSPRRD